MTTEPDASETRADWTLEGVEREPNFDLPMKQQMSEPDQAEGAGA